MPALNAIRSQSLRRLIALSGTRFLQPRSSLLPGAKPARCRRTGICAKRNTPKKAHKFNHIEPPSRKARKSYDSDHLLRLRLRGRQVGVAAHRQHRDLARPRVSEHHFDIVAAFEERR